jgi:hypothetical protein
MTAEARASGGGRATAGPRRAPPWEARSRPARRGSRTSESTSWIEDERAGLRRAKASRREKGSRWAADPPSRPKNARARWACCTLQLPLRQPLEPLQWLQHLHTPDAARVAETAGDSLTKLEISRDTNFPPSVICRNDIH